MIWFLTGVFAGFLAGTVLVSALLGPKPRPKACKGCQENPDNYS